MARCLGTCYPVTLLRKKLLSTNRFYGKIVAVLGNVYPTPLIYPMGNGWQVTKAIVFIDYMSCNHVIFMFYLQTMHCGVWLSFGWHSWRRWHVLLEELTSFVSQTIWSWRIHFLMPQRWLASKPAGLWWILSLSMIEIRCTYSFWLLDWPGKVICFLPYGDSGQPRKTRHPEGKTPVFWSNSCISVS